MRAIFSLCAVAGLTGCAPHLLSGNSAGGIVKVEGAFGAQSKGMAVADVNCRKFGKIARYEGINEIRGTLRYTCEKP